MMPKACSAWNGAEVDVEVTQLGLNSGLQHLCLMHMQQIA